MCLNLGLGLLAISVQLFLIGFPLLNDFIYSSTKIFDFEVSACLWALVLLILVVVSINTFVVLQIYIITSIWIGMERVVFRIWMAVREQNLLDLWVKDLVAILK